MKTKTQFILTEDSNIYFISDIHYNHFNSIRHGSRPFNDVCEMNDFIIKELKDKLKPNDILFDLGDMFWKTERNEIVNIISQIPCKNNIYKIIGNHDNYNLYYGDNNISYLFKGVFDLLDISVLFPNNKSYMFTLCHYPLVSWNHKPYGSLMIHGHCVDENTEILTIDGFRRYSDLNNQDIIYTFNPNTGFLEESSIDEIIIHESYCGDYYLLENTSTSMCITDKHIVSGINISLAEYKEIMAMDYFNNENQDFRLITSGKINITDNKFPLGNNELKLYILLSLYGCLKSSRFGKKNIYLKKKDEVSYVKNLLNNLMIDYTIKYKKKGIYVVNFYCPKNITRYKKLDKRLLRCSPEQVKLIFDVINNFSSILLKKEYCDFFQHLFVINGFSCNINKINDKFKLILSNNSLLSVNNQNATKIHTNGKLFWCIKTKNKNFICRRNGFVYLTGNCHGNIDDYNNNLYDLRLDIGFDSQISKELGSFIIPIQKIIEFFDRKTNGEDYGKWTLKNRERL